MNFHPVFPTSYERAGVITPGLPILPHGVERHPVFGGGSRAVPVHKGDQITVQDREGLQPVELVFFALNGTSDAEMIGAQGRRDPQGLKAALLGDPSGARVLKALDKAGFDIGKAVGVIVFPDGSNPGDYASFVASRDGLLIVCAPGDAMEPHEQWAPTEIVLYLRRANPGKAKDGLAPPDPLADPLADLNVQPGEARPYEVKAGQYVQILDVQGRECSDFQAFSMRALDKGLEREIDPTTTRSLMGSLYPMPGLFSKYFSMDQEPLVEIVQDTVGGTTPSVWPVPPAITRIWAIPVTSIARTTSTAS